MDLVDDSVTPRGADFFSGLYDQLCGTIATLTKAPVVVLSRRARPHTISIASAFGTSLRSVDERFALPRIRVGSHPLMYVPDLRSDFDFKNHPILELYPSARSLFALIVDGNCDGHRTILMIIDPCKNLVECPYALPAIHKLAEIAKGIRNIELVNWDDGSVARTDVGPPGPMKTNSVNRRILQNPLQQAQPGSLALMHQIVGFGHVQSLDLSEGPDVEPLAAFCSRH